MKKELKHISLSLVVAVILFSAGSFCVLPVAAAQTTDKGMTAGEMTGMGSHEEAMASAGIVTGHALGKIHKPSPQKHDEVCAYDCEQTLKAASLKKTKEFAELPLLAYSGEDPHTSQQEEPDIGSGPPRVFPLQEVILTVAKKE